jgi:hypothetical protein
MKDPLSSPEIQAALARLAAEDAAAAPPPELEAYLVGRFSAARAPGARPAVSPWLALGTTAALAFSAALIFRRAPEPRMAETPFVQIPFVAPPAPYERTEVVRQAVPITTLMAAGFEVHMADASGALTADVLRGQDGRTLAIRLVTGAERRTE